MNWRVPERAIVPMLSMTSCRSMPMPLSDTVMVRASLSKLTRIFNSGSLSYKAPSVSASKRNLSQASDALEISSRRKTSLLEYSECATKRSNCCTSA